MYQFLVMVDLIVVIVVCSVVFGLFVIGWIGSMCYFRMLCKDFEKEIYYVEEGNFDQINDEILRLVLLFSKVGF